MEIQTKRNGGAMSWLVKPRYLNLPMKNELFMMIIRMILTAISSHFEKKTRPTLYGHWIISMPFLFVYISKKTMFAGILNNQ